MSAMFRLKLFSTALLLTATPALAVLPYKPVPVIGPPTVGPGVAPPDFVYGKEYSHDFDFSVVGPVADPQQVIAWDGTGGTADAVDFSFSRPEWTPDQEIDAIANHSDSLFNQLRRDEAHLVFSHDDTVFSPFAGPISVPSFGPVTLSTGLSIGGAGEVSIEKSGVFNGFADQGVWAMDFEVNGMPLPADVDGLEVWGREPEESSEPDTPVFSDTDKYSLDVDFFSGVSVWNGAGTPYIGWGAITAAVETLLGPVPGTAFSPYDELQGHQAINLDALMVSDVMSDSDVFDTDPIGFPGDAAFGADLPIDQNGEPIDPFGEEGPRGDQIIFSIRQVLDPADPDGYYATGSELFLLDSLTGVSFLKHGGHTWDHGYSLTDLALATDPNDYAVIDINAIEAIGDGQLPPCIAGDYNCDGSVDAADYTVWRDSEGASGTGLPADGNGDGTVDLADYAVWASNYGVGSGPAMAMATAASTSVPEPTAAMLCLLAAAGFVCRRHG